MKTSSKRTGRSGQLRALTTQQLNLLTKTDLKNLADFAEHRMGRLPRTRISAEDVVQKALHAILRGTKKGESGRRPKKAELSSKSDFLHYIRSAINSVIEAMQRKRELWFDHESIYLTKSTDEPKPVVLQALSDPDQDVSLVDLKRELFLRLRKRAPAKLIPIIDEWEKTFFWESRVPGVRASRHRQQVRLLAMQVLKDMAEDFNR